MGFFDRLVNMVSGFFNSMIGNVEANNPEIVFEQAIIERKKKQAELKKAVSGIVYLRNKTEAELSEKENLLVEVQESIDVAMEEGDEESALILLEQQEQLEGQIGELRVQLENAKKQAEDAMEALNSYKASIIKLKREKEEVIAKAKTAEARIKIQEELDGLSLDSDSQALNNVREAVEKKAAEAQVGAELSESSIENRLAKIKQKTGSSRAKKRLAELKARRAAQKSGGSAGPTTPKRNI
jgi:phage shock protein A